MDGDATDPVLAAFLRALDADTARDELERVIMGVARPIVRAIVRATFRPGTAGSPPVDADDVEQTVLTNLTATLMRLRSPDPPASVRSLPDYSAVVAYNTCHAVLRVRAPGRARLRAHVRYVLTHHPALDVVEAPGHRKLASIASSTIGQSPASAEALDAALARLPRPAGWPHQPPGAGGQRLAGDQVRDRDVSIARLFLLDTRDRASRTHTELLQCMIWGPSRLTILSVEQRV